MTQDQLADQRRVDETYTLALIRAQCLTALMSNDSAVAWVSREATKPGRGGPVFVWTDLAKEYAAELLKP